VSRRTRHGHRTGAGITVRLAVRGFVDGGSLKFEDFVTVSEKEVHDILPALAKKHVRAMKDHELHMIEIEFLDEPDDLKRFFRFGSDPSRMVSPVSTTIGEAKAMIEKIFL
jgi:hypothetical protein